MVQVVTEKKICHDLSLLTKVCYYLSLLSTDSNFPTCRTETMRLAGASARWQVVWKASRTQALKFGGGKMKWNCTFGATRKSQTSLGFRKSQKGNGDELLQDRLQPTNAVYLKLWILFFWERNIQPTPKSPILWYRRWTCACTTSWSTNRLESLVC
jgi:hypothetical protein